MNIIEIAGKTAGYERINDDADHSIWVFYPEQLQAFADAIAKGKDAEIEQLNAKVGMLRGALNECLEDSKEVLNDYLQKYGENFKPHRVEAQKKIIAEAVQALSATEQDVTLLLNGVESNSIEAILRGEDKLTERGVFSYGRRMQQPHVSAFGKD